jgi:hypothetical protein
MKNILQSVSVCKCFVSFQHSWLLVGGLANSMTESSSRPNSCMIRMVHTGQPSSIYPPHFALLLHPRKHRFDLRLCYFFPVGSAFSCQYGQLRGLWARSVGNMINKVSYKPSMIFKNTLKIPHDSCLKRVEDETDIIDL